MNTNPYASTAAWVLEELAQPESPSRYRQTVWWSDLMVALVIKAALRHLPIDPAVSTQALTAAQILRSNAGECAAWSVDPSGHSVMPAGDTSAVHTLPGHHRGKSRQTLYHVLQTHTATSRTKRGGREKSSG